MLLHEWPLVLFTLLSQAALGIILTGEPVVCRLAGDGAQNRMRKQSIAALVFFGLAGLASMAHIGSPLNALNTVRNVGSSWLSREVLMVGVTGTAMLWLAWQRLKNAPQAAECMAAFITIGAGAVLVAVTSQVYHTPMVQTWNSPLSILSFFASSLILGAAWNALVLAGHKTLSSGSPGAPLPVFALAGLVLVAVSLPYSVPVLGAAANANTMLASVACLTGYAVWHALLSGIGVLLLVVLAVGWPGIAAASLPVSVLAFILIAAGEFVGRVAFYLAYVRIGM